MFFYQEWVYTNIRTLHSSPASVEVARLGRSFGWWMCGYIIATEIRGATTNSLDAQHRKHAKCMYGRRFGEGHTEHKTKHRWWWLVLGSLELFKGCVLERLDSRERERTGFWKNIVALVMELVYSCIRLDLRHHNFTLTQHRLTRYRYIYI